MSPCTRAIGEADQSIPSASAKIGTIRRYLEAVGGGLAVEFVMGDERVQVA